MTTLHRTRVPAEEVVDELARTFRSEQQRLVRTAATMTQDLQEAQDIVQNAYVGLQERLMRNGSVENPAGYLHVAVVNGCRSYWRRQRMLRLRPREPDLSVDIDEAVLRREEYKAVVAAVRKLPKRQQQAVILRYWSHLPDSEISRILGVAEATVRSNLSRGVTALARTLEVKK